MLPRWNFQNQVNTVGALIFIVLGGYLTWDMTRSTELPPCSARFGVPTQMSFQKADGAVLTPAEFQARVGIDERGVIGKTRMQRVIGEKPLLLSINLGGAQSDDTGVRFGWSLPGVDKAAGACLVYNVMLPADFNFASGGRLPGLHGQVNGPVADEDVTDVNAPITWNDQGHLTQAVQYTGATAAVQKTPNANLYTSASLARGRWVRIEQEVVLNRPEAADGVARLWVDGKLMLEKTQVSWRPHGGIRLKGMMADVSYLPTHVTGDRKPSVIQFTPPQMSWK